MRLYHHHYGWSPSQWDKPVTARCKFLVSYCLLSSVTRSLFVSLLGTVMLVFALFSGFCYKYQNGFYFRLVCLIEKFQGSKNYDCVLLIKLILWWILKLLVLKKMSNLYNTNNQTKIKIVPTNQLGYFSSQQLIILKLSLHVNIPENDGIIITQSGFSCY